MIPEPIAFRITVVAADEDMAAALLWEMGTTGIAVEPSGSAVSLMAYFAPRPALGQDLEESFRRLPGARVEPATVPQVDWVARFREGFVPFKVGSFLVAPSWNVAAQPCERLVVIDPGRAFGTGSHESTRLCLEALESLAASSPLGCVLDVGTGTGILAMAASLLGAASVTAVDVDPEAIEAARAHATLNGVALRLVRGDGSRPFRPRSFDTILANLTALLLIERSREIGALCLPGGHLILAGFLATEVAKLREAYSPIGLVRVRTKDEWAAVVLRARDAS